MYSREDLLSLKAMFYKDFSFYKQDTVCVDLVNTFISIDQNQDPDYILSLQ